MPSPAAPPPLVEPADMTLVDAARAIRSGRLTSSALLASCRRRIEQFEHLVRAWVLWEPQAQAAAAARDEEARRGAARGPLHGLPLGIKDLFDVAGLPTRSGSPLSSAEPVAADAEVVRRLRQAGALVLGKTVTTEWACFDPSVTRNPWHTECTPGGSSSGSAAAVALGMCPAALGSQTGGSITRPASFCGVCGLKPTWGRWSLQGATAVAYHLDHPGPLARSVADLALLAAALDGDDAAADAILAGDTLHVDRPPRLGWIKEFFWDEASPAVRQLMHAAVERLARSGAQVVEMRLPEPWPRVLTSHRTIMAVEAAQVHRHHFPTLRAQFGAHVAALLDQGFGTSAVEYAQALAVQRAWRAAWAQPLADGLTLLLPAVSTTAPRQLDTTGDPRFNSPWSLAGLPVVNLPSGLDADGLPGGLQLVGGWARDSQLLKVAHWCELALGFQDRPGLLAGVNAIA